MLTVESYPVAVAMCIITMLCWGSWANTQKLASTEWRFQLFYWDYALGVLLLSLLVAAIDIAGMAVAFPIGIGLALVLGVVTTYFAKPEGNVPMLAVGVGCVTRRPPRASCSRPSRAC